MGFKPSLALLHKAQAQRAARADFHAAHRTIFDSPYFLQVRLKGPLGLIVRMADIVASHWAFSGQFATARHLFHLVWIRGAARAPAILLATTQSGAPNSVWAV